MLVFSIISCIWWIFYFCYLNTSHVSIQPDNWKDIARLKTNLNTSHVSIQPVGLGECFSTDMYLNTSHVSIQLTKSPSVFDCINI